MKLNARIVIAGLVIVSVILFFLFTRPNPFRNVWCSRSKKEALHLLQSIHAFCMKHELRYFISYGTLLGQARQGGLIPWDDDIDVCMMEDDIAFFRKHFHPENMHTVDRPPFFKVCYSDRPSIGNKTWSWPFVDIFPLTNDGKVLDGGGAQISLSDVFPLRKCRFEGIDVMCPRNANRLLEKAYGGDWKEKCVSSSYNHREERVIEERDGASTARPCSAVL